MIDKKEPQHPENDPSQATILNDDVFGELTESGPNYRNVVPQNQNVTSGS